MSHEENPLILLFDTLSKAAEKRREQEKALLKKWGPPKKEVELTDDDGTKRIIGLWYFPKGIFFGPKRKNGYHPHEFLLLEMPLVQAIADIYMEK